MGVGHSHDGKPCTGHHGPGGASGNAHGGPHLAADPSGHSHADLSHLTEAQRAHLAKMLHARMELLQNQGEQRGHVFQYPEADELRGASGLLRGYGHLPPLPPSGWGDLVPPPPPPLPQLPSGGGFDVEAMMKTMAPSRDNYWQVRAPWGGRIRVVKDRGGLWQAGMVLLYWLYGNWSTWSVILIPHYKDGSISLALVLLYTAVSVLCITSFFRASTINPGALHTMHSPQADWTECQMCLHVRPPQAHHCRRCGQCVRKMDHHCPWINNCVGEENKFVFMLLLAYSFLLSAVTLVLQAMHFFWLDPCSICDQDSLVMRNQTGITVVCLVMALTMLGGSCSLYVTQHVSLISDTPTLEWMKQQRERFLLGKVPEYIPSPTMSVYEAYSSVCGGGLALCWLLPCRRTSASSALHHAGGKQMRV